MLRRFLAPLHPDGLKFVLAGAAATILLFLLWGRGGWIAVVVTLWLAYFFRDPWRVTPNSTRATDQPGRRDLDVDRDGGAAARASDG